ncbi:hypothetical protein BASA81_007283 [Batrachochytrium salamandrivorans]|nr:hypothetical protein BASA81_007283 [Batrachochytrium salamandrivorans]
MESPFERAGAGVMLPTPKASTNVQVVVRCRPSSQEERHRGVPEIVQVDSLSDEVRVTAPIKAGEKVFSYDRVFGSQSSQSEVYEKSVEPLVQQTLRGYNTTVLAYGQTGTGKTHTMEGEVDDPLEMGIIPRAMQSIFRTLDLKNDSESYVKASYLEIYNENLTDLLSSVPANAQDVPPHQQLRLVDDKSKSAGVGARGGVIVHNLEEVLVKSYEDVKRVMKFALSKRKVASTDLNERSSRSHAVFTVTVHSKELSPEGEELLRVGKLNLVDLAGSECVARSGSKDLRAREAGNINQSLLTLGRVITALVEKSPHISYRDSKLTRVLQESLGGCSLTLMIATVAPSVICLDETLSTLEYASRAKAIKNKPVANQKMTKRAAIRDYVEEIERLRQELQSARAKDGVYLSEEQYNAMQLASKSTSQRVQEVEQLVERRNVELRDLKIAYGTIKSDLARTNAELDLERDHVKRAQEEVRCKQQELHEEKLLVEEKQAVVDAHFAVEQKLHHIHDELQDRLRVAKDRIANLHDKLERKQHVEVENERQVGKLRAGMQSRLGELDCLVRQGKSGALESAAKVDDMLDKFQVLLTEEFVDSANTHRTSLMAMGKSGFNQLLEAQLEGLARDEKRAELEGQSNSAAFGNAANTLTSGAKLHQETVELCTASHAAEVDQLRKGCIEPLVAELEQSRKSGLALRDSLQTALGSLRQVTADMAVEYNHKLAEMQQEMAVLVATEKMRARKAKERAASQMASMLLVLQDESDKQLDLALAQLDNGKQLAMDLAGNSLGEMDNKLKQVLQGSETWVTEELARKQKLGQEANQRSTVALMSSAEAKESIIECSVETLALLQTGAGEAHEAQTKVESATQQTVAEWHSREHAFKTTAAALEQALSDLCVTAVEVDQELQQRGNSALLMAKQQVNDWGALTTEFCDSTLNTVQDSKLVVGEFSLVGDRSTGKTPSKLQVLEWSKEKPRTAPHSMIVERVRTSRNAAGRRSLSGNGSDMGDIEDASFSTRKKKTSGPLVLLSERDCNASGDDAAKSGENNLRTIKAPPTTTTNSRRLRQPLADDASL